jgi:hypothetical protein
MRGVVDYVVDQPHVTVDEVIPGPGFLPAAAVKKLSVDLAQRHVRASSCPRGAIVADAFVTNDTTS